MSGVKLYEPEHIYYMNREAVPSVTQILEDLGFYSSRFFTEAARERGNRVHEWVRRYEHWEDAPIDQDLQGYCEAYMSFCRDQEFSSEHSECSVFDEVYRYAGTLDLIGHSSNYGKTLLDIKTGQKASWHLLQASGYVGAVDKSGEIETWGALYLRSNGTYNVKLAREKDIIIFRKAAEVWWWQAMNGVRKWNPPDESALIEQGSIVRGVI